MSTAIVDSVFTLLTLGLAALYLWAPGFLLRPWLRRRRPGRWGGKTAIRILGIGNLALALVSVWFTCSVWIRLLT